MVELLIEVSLTAFGVQCVGAYSDTTSKLYLSKRRPFTLRNLPSLTAHNHMSIWIQSRLARCDHGPDGSELPSITKMVGRSWILARDLFENRQKRWRRIAANSGGRVEYGPNLVVCTHPDFIALDGYS